MPGAGRSDWMPWPSSGPASSDGGQHRDPVAIAFGQWDRDQHVGCGVDLRSQHAQSHPARQLLTRGPGEPHVAQHESHGERLAFERDVQQAPDGAVGTVAAHNIAE